MSETRTGTERDGGADAQGERSPDAFEEADRDELVGRLELLAEENRRLRTAYADASRTQYRRTAAGLAALGLVSLLASSAFPAGRSVLIALGGIGLFAGLLTHYLTPEQFLAASTGEATYAAHAAVGEDLVSELGLQDLAVYVPVPDPAGTSRASVLYVPQHKAFEIPTADALTSLFVVGDDEQSRGLALHPTGDRLVDEFEAAATPPLDTDAQSLADRLADGLVEQFELVDGAAPTLDRENDRVNVGISDSAYGTIDRFDHPVTSFFGVGLARGLDRPVIVDTVTAEPDRADYLVSYTLLDASDSAPPS